MTPSPTPFRRVLVANRGEIACRIIATLARRGIASVAVFSDADRASAHVRQADEAVALGGATAADSYLRADRIVEAALDTGADAVHPGYGFLSESAAFAGAVEAAGLAFVGPTPTQIEAFGDKDRARTLARAAGVPLLPGTGVLPHLEAAAAEAEAIGYPVLLKATAGGGGIGMARCDGPGDLTDAWARVTRAGTASFGSGALFIERFLPVARHVEVQVVRRRARRRGGARRSRLLGAAPQPEGRRGGARARPLPRGARRAARGGTGPGPLGATTARWARSSSSSTRRGASSTSSRSTPASRSSTA